MWKKQLGDEVEGKTAAVPLLTSLPSLHPLCSVVLIGSALPSGEASGGVSGS